MSTISASTTSTTAYKVTADTTGTLVLQTGSSPTTAATFDANQNMGLGVVPSAWSGVGKALQIGASVALAGDASVYLTRNAYYASSAWRYTNATNVPRKIAMDDNGFTYSYSQSTGAIGGAITFTDAFTVDTSGNVGIGTTPATSLHAYKSSGSVILTTQSGSTYGYFGNDGTYVFLGSNQGATGVKFKVSLAASDNSAIIDSGGNFLIGNTTAGGTGTYRGLTIAGGLTASLGVGYDYAGAVYHYNSVNENGWIWWNDRNTGGLVQEFFVNNGTKVGNINCSTTATNYVTSSDYRLKENVQPMVGALEKVARLKPCTYTWKIDGSDGQGFIAHELGEVVPQCVHGEKDAVKEDGSIDPQGIDTSFLVATLTAAIQELKAELDAAKADIATLKGAA